MPITPPRFVYRVDSRSPEEIFQNGFVPWGFSRDFVRHIAGIAYSTENPGTPEQMPYFISTSENIEAVIRFYAGVLHAGIAGPQIWLYRIRATENFYSAALTAQDMNLRISQNLVVYEGAATEEQTLYLMSEVLSGMYSYDREWFSDGPIPRETIQFAGRLTRVPLGTDGAYGPRVVNPTSAYYTFTIMQEPDIVDNPHYVSEETQANSDPWTMAHFSPITPIHVDLTTSTVFTADVSAGVASPLSFACSSPEENFYSEKNRLHFQNQSKNQPLECFVPYGITSFNLKKEKSLNVFASEIESSFLYVHGSQTKKEFLVKTVNNNTIASSVVYVDPNLKAEVSNKLLFDTYGRITLGVDKTTGLSYAWTAVRTKDASVWQIQTKIAVTNLKSQQWKIYSKTFNAQSEFIIQSNYIGGDFIAVIKKSAPSQIFLVRKDDYDKNIYEELIITISPEKTRNSFILSQAPLTNMQDLKLSWEYQNILYSLIPETGWSKEGGPEELTFLYDLISQKILYIQKGYNNILTLKNQRHKNEVWNWVEWVKSSALPEDDKTLRWVFTNPKYKSLVKFVHRVIYCMNGDVLWVTFRGSKWGGVWTTSAKVVETPNSFGLFVVDDNFTL